jgi:MYXO-CTERM domain-containing protein
MNTQNRKLCAYAAMAIALSLSPLAAYGQTTASPATNATTSSQTTTADDRGDRREHHDYGWIGLLGLLGLTGLMRKRHEDRPIGYSDRTDTRRSMTGSRS